MISVLGSAALAWRANTGHTGVEDAYDAHWQNKFRKIGRFIKLVLAGAGLAVKNAGDVPLPAHRTGVFLGTGLGNLADLVPFVHSLYDDAQMPSPIMFANSVGNSGAFYVAQALGLEGPVLAVCQDELSFEGAVMNASLAMDAGEIDLAIVGGADVFVAPLNDHVARLGFDPKTHAAMPLGEGCGFWLLAKGGGRGLADVLSARVGGDDAVAELRAHALPFDGPRALYLCHRLRPQEAALCDVLKGAAPIPATPGPFPTETATAAAAFALNGAPGSLFHSVSCTREGLIGTLTVRKRTAPVLSAAKESREARREAAGE